MKTFCRRMPLEPAAQDHAIFGRKGGGRRNAVSAPEPARCGRTQ